MRKEKLSRFLSQKKLKEVLEKSKRKNILVVGDVILDNYIYGDVSRISPEHLFLWLK